MNHSTKLVFNFVDGYDTALVCTTQSGLNKSNNSFEANKGENNI